MLPSQPAVLCLPHRHMPVFFHKNIFPKTAQTAPLGSTFQSLSPPPPHPTPPRPDSLGLAEGPCRAGWQFPHSGSDRLPPHQVFREQGIDGETLPLLTEEHLLTTMGLKLGPALKIRAQVRASGAVVPHPGGTAPRPFLAADPQPRPLSIGCQAPGPSLLHGQLPGGVATAATSTAGPRAGAHLRGAAPVPSNGPLALWGGTAHCWPSFTQARERDRGSASRAFRPLPASVLSCGEPIQAPTL